MDEISHSENPDRGLVLSARQSQVLDVLKAQDSGKFSLSQWYLGALYAINSTLNQDRFSQAAQSIREILEKLSWLVTEKEGKKLNEILPDVLKKTDPMLSFLDSKRLQKQVREYKNTYDVFTGYAHHKRIVDPEQFEKEIWVFEEIAINMLAVTTAEEHDYILSILNKPDPISEEKNKVLGLLNQKGANYSLFFSKLENPAWIPFLRENGLFELPEPIKNSDGSVMQPAWMPIRFSSARGETSSRGRC